LTLTTHTVYIVLFPTTRLWHRQRSQVDTMHSSLPTKFLFFTSRIVSRQRLNTQRRSTVVVTFYELSSVKEKIRAILHSITFSYYICKFDYVIVRQSCPLGFYKDMN